MSGKSLENFIEKSWNFAKKTIGSSRAKKAAAFIFGCIAYLGLGTEANAQVTAIIDSISISAGYSPENREPRRFREPVWELKDGVPQVRKTIDFGIVKVDGPPWNLPGLVYGSGFGVDYVDAKWDTVVVTGKVYRYPEDTPIEGAGVNLWNAFDPLGPSFNGEFLGGNYLEDRAIYTDKEGKFSMPIRIKVRKAPASIDSMVTVLVPNGGENWQPGSTHEIVWENNYGLGSFKIFLSINNGVDWDFIGFGDKPKNESRTIKKYDWKIPEEIQSSSCKIKVIDFQKQHIFDVSDSSFSINLTTDVLRDNSLLNEFKLSQNYPNPFNPSTTIKYTIPKQNKVTLKVFDVLGSELATLINKEQPQGNYEVEFDGSELTSGIYLYRLQAGDFVETKKMILMK